MKILGLLTFSALSATAAAPPICVEGGESLSLSTTRGCFLVNLGCDGAMSPRDLDGVLLRLSRSCWSVIAGYLLALEGAGF